MAIWNGLTEQGAVVPIQVDSQGRVVVAGSGGAPSEVYGTAIASGRFAGNGVALWSMNLTISTIRTGEWEFSFINAPPNDQYGVLATVFDGDTHFPVSTDQTRTSFRIRVRNQSGVLENKGFALAVFNDQPSSVTPLILPNSALQDIQRLKEAVGLADP